MKKQVQELLQYLGEPLDNPLLLRDFSHQLPIQERTNPFLLQLNEKKKRDLFQRYTHKEGTSISDEFVAHFMNDSVYSKNIAALCAQYEKGNSDPKLKLHCGGEKSRAELAAHVKNELATMPEGATQVRCPNFEICHKLLTDFELVQALGADYKGLMGKYTVSPFVHCRHLQLMYTTSCAVSATYPQRLGYRGFTRTTTSATIAWP